MKAKYLQYLVKQVQEKRFYWNQLPVFTKNFLATFASTVNQSPPFPWKNDKSVLSIRTLAYLII
jgi:hypothetical protein